MEAALRDIEALLNKKTTFEAAARRLAATLADGDAPLSAEERTACVVTCRRALTLLQARYSGRGFWLAGREAFTALQARLGDCGGLATSALQRCAEELDEDEGAEVVQPPPQRPPRFLFEGQFSPSAPAAAPPPAAAGLPPGAAALAALLGVEDDGDVLVGLERALAASLADAPPQHAGPPPAGRDAVRALRVEPLTRARLDALGGGVQCAVCREELREGDDVQRMPCSDAHCFHPPCLAPWLAQHNSCPVCRHELPTDDWRYEDRKRDAAQRAEDERGAANALRGGEFMWL